MPDRLVFEGRAPVRVGEDPAAARAAVEAAVLGACPEVTLEWTGGQFASGATPTDHPLAQLALAATGDELGRPARFGGVPWGADMRLWCAEDIPTVMVGTNGIELAHAVDERVAVGELVMLGRILERIGIAVFG